MERRPPSWRSAFFDGLLIVGLVLAVVCSIVAICLGVAS